MISSKFLIFCSFLAICLNLLVCLVGCVENSFFYLEENNSPLLHQRVKRGSASAAGHGDFSGVAKMSTFASLGAYGGHVGYGSGGNTAGGYSAGSGGYSSAGGISVPGALGSYGGYLGHKGPTVISSGGFGNGGLLFGKI